MRILVLNSGSSSVKYQLFNMSDRSLLVGGSAERIGTDDSRLTHRIREQNGNLQESVIRHPLPDHAAALDRIGELLNEAGQMDDLAGIGHRVVHGGEVFRQPTLIDPKVVETIRGLSSLAPLHNPANLLGIEVALARLPNVPQVAVFDTAFHHTIPPRAHRYAVPESWYEIYGVRRYGFHGTSHAYVAKQTAEYFARPLEELNLIVLHLGNGASVTAIQDGESVDTSMGLTPLEGLVMGTRSGDIDPALIFHVSRQSGESFEKIDSDLNERSGLAGLCGESDVRDVLEREAAGDEKAKLALDVYIYRIRKYIGSYIAVLGRVDAIVFTAGVGENSAEIRRRVCEGLERLGIELDAARNQAVHAGVSPIHTEGSPVSLLVVSTNEELAIADETLGCISDDKSKPTA